MNVFERFLSSTRKIFLLHKPAKMKRIILSLLLFMAILFAPSLCHAQKSYKPKTVHVRSYTTKSGKTVRSHWRSKPTRRKHSYVMPVMWRKEMAA